MINLYIKLESYTKLLILAFFLMAPASLAAEINVKNWSKECTKENICFIAIKSEIEVPGSDKKQALATAFVQLATKIEKKMDLIDGKEKTYKLKEENKLIPIIYIKFPLNSDLQKKPLIQIDKTNIGNVNFSHCNNSEGCSANLTLNDEVVKYFKAGDKMIVTFGVHRSGKNISVTFPLKGFAKSYKSLLK